MTPQGPAEMQIAIAAFNTMQSQIKRLVEGQAAMFAAISHDLRTPLTRMRLRGEFIEDPDQQARLFRDVDEMQTMIEAMLMFLRDNAANERTTSLDLAELLRSIADDYADIGSDVAYTGPQHVAFPGRPIGLRRAFGNLVDNAVKYGARPTIDLQCQGDAVQVTITDQGPGIPTDALEQVFVPFRRLSRRHGPWPDLGPRRLQGAWR
jgi:signal transduction histidine kinase